MKNNSNSKDTLKEHEVKIAFIILLFSLLTIVIAKWNQLEKPDELNLKLLGLVGAIIAFCIGLFQYYKAQKWKKTEFLAQEYKTFVSDRYVQRVMHLLDYPVSDFQLFDDEVLAHSLTGYFFSYPDKKIVVECNYSVIAMALSKDFDDETPATFDSKMNIIRFSFDKFLFKLGVFHKHIGSGLIKVEDVVPYISYWIRFIKKTENEMLVNNKDSFIEMKKSFIGFIFRYKTDYRSLDSLLGNFETNIETLAELHGVKNK